MTADYQRATDRDRTAVGDGERVTGALKANSETPAVPSRAGTSDGRGVTIRTGAVPNESVGGIHHGTAIGDGQCVSRTVPTDG